MSVEQKQTKYKVVVDIEGLIKLLSDEAFKECTKDVPEEDIWTEITVIEPGLYAWSVDVEVTKKEINSYWCYEYMAIKQKYTEIVDTFVKK